MCCNDANTTQLLQGVPLKPVVNILFYFISWYDVTLERQKIYEQPCRINIRRAEKTNFEAQNIEKFPG